MWIFPVSPEDLAHPKQCADCGRPIIQAKNEKGQAVTVNPNFKVLETLTFGDDGYLQLLADESSHTRTCEKKSTPRPAMTRNRRKKHVDI
jgi:hypothetical protein